MSMCTSSVVDLSGSNIIFLFSQVILLSATMPADVLEVTKRFMRDPIQILVRKEELTLEGIKQFYISVEREVNFFSIVFYVDVTE